MEEEREEVFKRGAAESADDEKNLIDG